MNWIKEPKIAFFFLIGIIWIGCQYLPEKKLITSKWLFKSVTKNNISQIRITDADFFELNADSSFKYEMAFVNKKKSGKWHFQNHILTLKYQNPDTIRNFEIKVLSKYELLFVEDSVEYLLEKEH